jgi:hypothetical protein
MDTLQSRLDAEFLLAHMCSVKFKEWIVVLATLLRRAEVKLVEFIILRRKGLFWFIPFLDPTHVGASGTRCALKIIVHNTHVNFFVIIH